MSTTIERIATVATDSDWSTTDGDDMCEVLGVTFRELARDLDLVLTVALSLDGWSGDDA